MGNLTKVVEFEKGIEATYSDGHTAHLSFDGKRCTCGGRMTSTRVGDVLCLHLSAALPAYKNFKWRKVDGNDNYQTRGFLASVGIDPAIFNPPAVDWNRLEPDVHLVWRKLWRKQKGWLFQFRDGAFFALVEDHPDGMTRCSACRSRDCKHVRQALEEFRRGGEAVAI